MRTVDEETLSDSYPATRLALVDRDYQGVQRDITAAYPIKQAPGAGRNNQYGVYNTKLSSARVIHERYFERQVTVWAILHRQFH